jgi:hypothetical protein
MKSILYFALFISISSCSLFKKSEYSFEPSTYEIQSSEYIDQISNLSRVYLSSKGIKENRASKKTKKYLTSVYMKLVSNNKLLLKTFHEPKFFIINSEVPFYFSLPKAQFFFSSGLILKYIKNEEMFIAALSSEVVKSQRNIYPKRIMVPKGYITSEELISYVRLPINVKNEINKWTYHVIKRSGHDPYAYLIWLQSLNKNTLDFSLLYGNTQDISKEEHLFKNFISKIKTEEFLNSERRKNSSPSFYSFVRDVKRRAN